MCDENTFATAYRSDLRDEIVETLKDYADGITPTKQWCWDRYDDVELPVTGNDNGSWTCNASKSSENMQNVMFSDDWDGFIHSDYAYDAPLDDAEKLEVFYRTWLCSEEFDNAVSELLAE